MKKIFVIVCLLPTLAFAHGLVQGTPVRTPGGHVAVETLKSGDTVLSCDFTGICIPAPIIETSATQADGFVEIEHEGETLGLSASHPVWSDSENQWVDASTMAVRYISGPVTLHNIGVAEHHNYYIGKQDLLVHNLVFMIPVLAWGANLGPIVGAAIPAILAGGAASLALNEVAKHSNSPVETMSYLFPGGDAIRTAMRVQREAAEHAMQMGRHDNDMRPDPGERGYHTTRKPSPTGNPAEGSWTEWIPNPKNPTGFDKGKSYHGSGSKPEGHYNPVTGQHVPHPHVHDPKTPGGIRAPTPDEIPK